MQTLAKSQGKHHWQNKLWRIDDGSLIKRILKQFKDTSAPNLHIRSCACAYKLLVNYVEWLLLFSVESMIRGYHDMEQPYSRRGTGVQKGTGKSRRFVVKCNAMLSSFLAIFESLSRSQC